MDSQTAALIADWQSRPKHFRVSTHYADGQVKTRDMHALGQAENWATGERHKLGRDLIDRETGKTVRVIDVKIERIQ